MLPRRNRLSRQRSIRTILRGGRRLTGTFMTIRHQPSATDHARTTFVVSRRVDKLATVRNRTKRRMREAMRPLLAAMNRQDVVVIAQPSAKSASLLQLRTELHALLSRAAHV